MSNQNSNLKDFPTKLNSNPMPQLDMSMGKEESRVKAKQAIDHIFNKIDELDSKKDMVKAEAKEIYVGKINQLKNEKKQLEVQYKELMNVADDKWDETKKSFVKASDSFNQGISELTKIIG